MGKGSAKFEVTDYLLSAHWGFCTTADALLGLYFGEKEAWSGDVPDTAVISINRPDLFGGVRKEGGVAGVATFLPGKSNQVLNNALAGRLGLTSATCPAYRGVTSIFYTANTNGGFLWGSNNPYLKTIWAKLRRAPKVFTDTSLRMIGTDANPAAIIAECLTNGDWGMGGALASLNMASFVAAAVKLLAEGFGLSIKWTRQATIEDFVSEILDHIQAKLFINPADGLWTLKLIRDDYDPDALPVIDETNCDVISFDRKTWGDIVNEVAVTWTNPENEKEETVTAQNLASIIIQGGVVSTSRNFYGVRSRDLAQRLAERELAFSSSPFASFEINVSREAWNFVPGDCVTLNYPEEGIEGLVLRIMTIDYGKAGDMVIKLSCVEDIFAYPSSGYTVPDPTAWVNPTRDPTPMDRVRIITAPQFFVSRALSAADAEALQYPEVFAAFLGATTNTDTRSYELIGQAVQPNGDIVAELGGSKPPLGYTVSSFSLPAEPVTTVASLGNVLGPTPRVAGFMFIGDAADASQEIALLQSRDDDTGAWTLYRGVLDTVPRSWPVGTRIWFVPPTTEFVDTNTIQSDTETVTYKLVPSTGGGTLPIADAPVVGVVMNARPYCPLRPANVTVAGVAFGAADVSGSTPSSIPVTWANRNRLTEDSTVVPWTAGNVTPEPGQTTRIEVRKTDGTLVTAHTGLTGTSFNIPMESFGSESQADVFVMSTNGPFTSLQAHVIRVKIAGAAPVTPPDTSPEPGYTPPPGTGFPSFPRDPGGPTNIP